MAENLALKVQLEQVLARMERSETQSHVIQPVQLPPPVANVAPHVALDPPTRAVVDPPRAAAEPPHSTSLSSTSLHEHSSPPPQNHGSNIQGSFILFQNMQRNNEMRLEMAELRHEVADKARKLRAAEDSKLFQEYLYGASR